YKPNRILASYHTHGAFDPRVLTETPSSIDFDAVASEQTDAFIATPGGRFWRINSRTGVAHLLCGPHDCMERDMSSNAEPRDVLSTLNRSQVSEIEERSGTTVKR